MLSRPAAITIATLHYELANHVRWTPIAKVCDAASLPSCTNCAHTGLPLLHCHCSERCGTGTGHITT